MPCKRCGSGLHPYHASDRAKDEKNSARGCSRPHLGSWYKWPVHLRLSVKREFAAVLSLDAACKQPELFVYGRRGSTYYKYRNRDIAATWEGDTDQPGVEIAETISNTLMDAT